MSGSAPTPPPWKAAASLHLDRARKNYQFYQRLAAEGVHLDWAATVLFYTVLHLVQTCLIHLATTPSQVPRDHSDRRYYVSTRLGPIFQDYRILEDLARDMRYYPAIPPPPANELRRYEQEPFSRIVAELRSRGVSLDPQRQRGARPAQEDNSGANQL